MPLPSSLSRPLPRLPVEVIWRIAFFATWRGARILTEGLTPRLIKPVKLFGRREEAPFIEIDEPRDDAPLLVAPPADFDPERFFDEFPAAVWETVEIRQVPFRPSPSSRFLETGFLEIRRDSRNTFLPLTLTRLLSPLGYVIAWSLRAGEWINIDWHPVDSRCTCHWSCFSSHPIHEPCNHEPTRDVPWAVVHPEARRSAVSHLSRPTSKLMRAVRNSEYGVVRFCELSAEAQRLYSHFVEIVGWWDHLPDLVKIHLAANFYSLNRDLGFTQMESLEISEVPQTLGSDYMRT